MPRMVQQTCTMCQKTFEISFGNRGVRQKLGRDIDGLCGIDCRNMFLFMVDPDFSVEKVPGVNHGTSHAYNSKCRCWTCRDRNADRALRYRNNRKKKIENGNYKHDGTFKCSYCNKDFKIPLNIAKLRSKTSKSGRLYCSLSCSAFHRHKLKGGAQCQPS